MREATYVSLLERLSLLPCPKWTADAFRSPEGGREWLSSRGLEGRAEDACWTLFLLSLVPSALLAFALGWWQGPLLALPPLLLPIIASSLLGEHPRRLVDREERRILSESPEIIADLSISMQMHQSLENSLVQLTQGRDGVLVSRMRGALWDVMTRRSASIVDSMIALADDLSELNDGLRQAIHLLISSTEERTRDGLDRALDRANEVTLSGIKERVEDHSSSLQMPVLLLFSVGILLPVMLFSILPLSVLGGTSIPAPLLSLLLVVVLPLSALLISERIAAGSPLAPAEGKGIDLRAVAAGALLPLATYLLTPNLDERLRSLIIVLPACLAVLALTRREGGEEVDARRAIQSLFALGNRLQAGMDVLECLRKAGDGPFGTAADVALARHTMSREALVPSLGEAMRDWPPTLRDAFLTVIESAQRDPVRGGKVAIDLARYLSDLEDTRRNVDNKLKGVVDMMRSTSTFFAPIILGITLSLLSPLGGGEGMVLMTAVFLCELGLVITRFTSSLDGRGDINDMLSAASPRIATSVVVFIASLTMASAWSTGLI